MYQYTHRTDSNNSAHDVSLGSEEATIQLPPLLLKGLAKLFSANDIASPDSVPIALNITYFTLLLCKTQVSFSHTVVLIWRFVPNYTWRQKQILKVLQLSGNLLRRTILPL